MIITLYIYIYIYIYIHIHTHIILIDSQSVSSRTWTGGDFFPPSCRRVGGHLSWKPLRGRRAPPILPSETERGRGTKMENRGREWVDQHLLSRLLTPCQSVRTCPESQSMNLCWAWPWIPRASKMLMGWAFRIRGVAKMSLFWILSGTQCVRSQRATMKDRAKLF